MRPIQFIFYRFAIFIFPFLLSACVSHSDTSDFDKQAAAKARVELALGYLQQQNSSQAKLNLDKALSYAPKYSLVHAALAYFYQQQGDVEHAKQAYLTAIKLDDKQGDVLNNFGAFLCAQGEYQAAYKQSDTYENLALCALSAKDQKIYQENLTALEKIAPERAKRFAQFTK